MVWRETATRLLFIWIGQSKEEEKITDILFNLTVSDIENDTIKNRKKIN